MEMFVSVKVRDFSLLKPKNRLNFNDQSGVSNLLSFGTKFHYFVTKKKQK